MTRASDTARLVSGGAVLNEASNDVDFRVESNDEENMLFVDGGNNRVGIGTTGGSGETLTVTKTGADATVRVNAVSSQEAALKLQGNNTVTNTFKIASEEDDSGLTIQKWNGSAYVTHLKSDANGIITKPLQPAFSVTNTGSAQSWNAGTTTQVTFDSERFDLNGDFGSNQFTAPVDGKYYLSINMPFQNLDTGATSYLIDIFTSNRRYLKFLHMGLYGGSDNSHGFSLSILADMDANDIAKAQVAQNGGSNQTSLNNDAEFLHFTGYLVC
jgi:hypothetical protein